jgi:hypothetical protein
LKIDSYGEKKQFLKCLKKLLDIWKALKKEEGIDVTNEIILDDLS